MENRKRRGKHFQQDWIRISHHPEAMMIVIFFSYICANRWYHNTHKQSFNTCAKFHSLIFDVAICIFFLCLSTNVKIILFNNKVSFVYQQSLSFLTFHEKSLTGFAWPISKYDSVQTSLVLVFLLYSFFPALPFLWWVVDRGRRGTCVVILSKKRVLECAKSANHQSSHISGVFWPTSSSRQSFWIVAFVGATFSDGRRVHKLITWHRN